MQITYDHQIFSWQEYGGISRYFVEIAKRIQSFDGYDVSILSPLFVNKYLKDDTALAVEGRYCKKFPKSGRIILALNCGMVRWKLHRKPPDIVHETYYMESRTASSATKTVVTVHDMIHEKFPELFRADDRTSQRKKAAVGRADHVICVSENTRSDLIDMFDVKSERISVIYLGCSKLPSRAVETQHGDARPYIAYVGPRQGCKNFAGLIRAFGLSEFLRKNLSIVCFGGGPFTSTERAEAARSGLQPDHVIQAKGGDEMLGTIYKGAEALVYPSLYEGFGLPPLEAMAAGCPVVCSKTSSLPEVCGDAAEYFDPYRPESIAAAVERVATSAARKQELATLGLQRIAKFSWDKCAMQTAKVYASIA